jgi:hypothetical protein
MTAITQLANLNKGTTKGKQEELTKTNITFHRICFEALHGVRDVQNSLLEHLTPRLRHHETLCLSEQSLLREA